MVEQLSETYEIDKDTVVSIVELVIRESIFSYFGKDSQVYYDNGEIKIYVYDGNNQSQPFDLNSANEEFITYLRKQLTERFLFKKTSRNYNAIKHLRHTLVGGYPVEKMNGHYLVKLNDMLFDTKNILPYRYTISKEQLKLAEYYFFIVLRVQFAKIGLKFDLTVYLSRTSSKLPELLLQKAVEEDTGVNIDCKCVERVPGKYSILETKVKIPKKIVSYVQENLNNEKVIIKVAKRR